MLVSLYPCITDTTHGSTQSLPNVVAGIRAGRWRPAVETVRALDPASGDYRLAKSATPYFTTSGTFGKREDEGLLKHSGVVALDVDKQAVDRAAVESDPYTLGGFTSIGGNGYCILCRIPADATTHEAHYRALRTYYEATYSLRIDPLADVSRPRFVSYDPAAFWNPDAQVWLVQAAPPAPAAPPRPYTPPAAVGTDAAPLLRYLADQVLTAPDGEKHNTLNRAAFTAGGWVAAGRCEIDAARDVLRSAIEQRGAADLQAAYRTIEDGLKAGQKVPLYDTRPAPPTPPPAPRPLPSPAPIPTHATPAFRSVDVMPEFDELWVQMLADRHAGKRRGETTHFPKIDTVWKFVRSKVVGVTGWPQHGKTELVLQLLLIKALRDEWNSLVFSPESEPLGDLYTQMAEAWTGRTTDTDYTSALTDLELKAATKAIHRNVRGMHLPQHDLDSVLAVAEMRVQQLKDLGLRLDVLVCDPWNSMEHDLQPFGGRDDRYLRAQINRLQRFARKHEVCVLVLVHPSGSPRTADGRLREPDQYMMEGGRMWANLLDDVWSIHRPDIDDRPGSTRVEFESHKIKKQKRSGCRPGKVELDYRRELSRYYQTDGWNPFPSVGATSRADSAGDAALVPPKPYDPYQGLTASRHFERALPPDDTDPLADEAA